MTAPTLDAHHVAHITLKDIHTGYPVRVMRAADMAAFFETIGVYTAYPAFQAGQLEIVLRVWDEVTTFPTREDLIHP
jgi:hypothetical protein